MREHAAAVAVHAEGMGGVIDDLEVVVVGNALDGLDVAGVAVAMHRQDGGGARRDRGLDLLRVQVQRVRVDVHEHRGDAVP